MRPSYPTARLFVTLWERSSSITQVSQRLLAKGYDGMRLRAVRRWARTLREMGVKIKRMAGPWTSRR